MQSSYDGNTNSLNLIIFKNLGSVYRLPGFPCTAFYHLSSHNKVFCILRPEVGESELHHSILWRPLLYFPSLLSSVSKDQGAFGGCGDSDRPMAVDRKSPSGSAIWICKCRQCPIRNCAKNLCVKRV